MGWKEDREDTSNKIKKNTKFCRTHIDCFRGDEDPLLPLGDNEGSKKMIDNGSFYLSYFY